METRRLGEYVEEGEISVFSVSLWSVALLSIIFIRNGEPRLIANSSLDGAQIRKIARIGAIW